MTDPNPPDAARAALAAFEAGDLALAELEAAIAAALAAGTLLPAAATAALQVDVTRGRIPQAMLERLGLARGAAVEATTVVEPASSAQTQFRRPGTTAVAPPARGSETLLRPAPRPWPAPVAPLAANAPRDTASEWVEAGTPSGPSAEEVAVGQLLGDRYLLERKLGDGGMGVVFFASDQTVKGETFAVKILKPEIREHPESLALLRDEVRRTRNLGHPNIVGVYSLNADAAHVYMLMEYLEGKTLNELIDEDFGRGIPFARAWPLIQDIGAGLAYAHDHSVIHSDLKPANVFVTTAGKAKLLDFGIARAARGRELGTGAAALGALTPAYASCEMLEGGEPDVRDDVYALGCVVYEMLCGKHPFAGRTAVEARDENRRPPAIPGLSRAQNAALQKSLAFNREQRTASVEALMAGLAPGGAGWARAGLAAAVVVLLVLAVAAGWWWRRGGRQEAPPDSATPSLSIAEANNRLARVRALEADANRLGVDPADARFANGAQALRAAERQLAEGTTAAGGRSLDAAETALRAALASGGRVAQLGSEPEEVVQAENLCRATGRHCAPGDFADEAPRRVVLRPFVMDATGVTNAAFAEFVSAKGYTTEAERGRGLFSFERGTLLARPKDSWKTLRDQAAARGEDPAGLPVRGIDFEAAKAYCAFRGARLPTEEEWEFVARVDRRIFPWGNEPVRPGPAATARLLPVLEQPATGRFGVRGLGAALWEWVDGGTDAERIFRGASWLDTDPVHQRLAQRGFEIPTRAHIDTGFRCARDSDAWPAEAGS